MLEKRSFNVAPNSKCAHLADAKVSRRAAVVGRDLEAPVASVVGPAAQAAPVHDVVLVTLPPRVVRIHHELLAPAGGARLRLGKAKGIQSKNEGRDFDQSAKHCTLERSKYLESELSSRASK